MYSILLNFRNEITRQGLVKDMKQIGVGLLGFGTVGAGVVKGLQERRELLAQKIGADIVLRRIADLDIKSDRGVTVDPAILTTEASEVINDPAVDV